MAERFKSSPGDQPWFFVPDTGDPGGSAVLIDGKGKSTEVTETQTTTGEGSSFGPRVGFRVPAPLKKGSYSLVITQGKSETRYDIEVDDEVTASAFLRGENITLTTEDGGK